MILTLFAANHLIMTYLSLFDFFSTWIIRPPTNTSGNRKEQVTRCKNLCKYFCNCFWYKYMYIFTNLLKSPTNFNNETHLQIQLHQLLQLQPQLHVLDDDDGGDDVPSPALPLLIGISFVTRLVSVGWI